MEHGALAWHGAPVAQQHEKARQAVEERGEGGRRLLEAQEACKRPLRHTLQKKCVRMATLDTRCGLEEFNHFLESIDIHPIMLCFYFEGLFFFFFNRILIN